ncbi:MULTISPECIES: isochorismatase family protein [Actinomycetes]|uniref:isochorismatase family protein n=1 Tax=Actinomycetes TaxID=1760 RepID=UPI00264834B8|nr:MULTISPECIES: isochorismatase family protein [Actinomycetes]MDN6622341.1 isochorismatase family protein [Bifidobacterium crudilactis]MDN6226989.1 isochorismatase family protein [Corynebacterium flavescens]MDN6457022.1 isochorismatase family protein [Yaniella sp.]MDN6646404.1 isochorismatase family protein [Corynebacterium flavescens]MDN6688353.1 isochorismatase family protein [Corynebacterium flavescens]
MAEKSLAELNELLNEAFEANTKEYKKRGFQRRVGYGTRPAVIHIDMANAWTRPDHVFSCENMDVIIPACQKLNDAARAKGIPVIYTTTAFDVTDASKPNDMGMWVHKIPLDTLKIDSEDAAIDSRMAPEEGELVIVKKHASGFAGTDLATILNNLNIDTVIITGVTAAGCVRHSVEDAVALGFRPIIAKEAVGDRVAGVVAWNLFDMDAKFGDVEATDDIVEYLNSLPPFEEQVPTFKNAITLN